MSARTSIEWTDASWNPVRGCTKVSEGCRHCWAMRMAARMSKPGQWGHGFGRFRDGAPEWTGRVELVPGMLSAPLRWRKPRRVFLSSFDLFHEALPDEAIDRVFAVMALARQHTFQVLTKRPERMRRYLETPRECLGYAGDPVVAPVMHVAWRAGQLVEDGDVQADAVSCGPWPLPNVWLGVSVEDQATADERIPLLLQTPAAVRFVSYEPALGPVDFRSLRCGPSRDAWLDALGGMRGAAHSLKDGRGLDWIIVGGESGPGARPFDVVWARAVVGQCKDAGVACFVKQLGAVPFDGAFCGHGPADAAHLDNGCIWRLSNRMGVDPLEWPKDLRVREFPETPEPLAATSPRGRGDMVATSARRGRDVGATGSP
jgi:protein gp37